MPIYEYECNKCKRRSELLVSISKADDAQCPECGSKEMRRLISMFASHIAGSDSGHSSGCAGCSSGHCSTCGSSH